MKTAPVINNSVIVIVMCCVVCRRQQKLEQLAEKFSRKAGLREAWLKDMSQVLDELNKGQDVHGVDAALKRHEAISTDIQAGEVRIQVKGVLYTKTMALMRLGKGSANVLFCRNLPSVFSSWVWLYEG